jgi:hypothetical protein
LDVDAKKRLARNIAESLRGADEKFQNEAVSTKSNIPAVFI